MSLEHQGTGVLLTDEPLRDSAIQQASPEYWEPMLGFWLDSMHISWSKNFWLAACIDTE